jgi:hypothetical protein
MYFRKAVNMYMYVGISIGFHEPDPKTKMLGEHVSPSCLLPNFSENDQIK